MSDLQDKIQYLFEMNGETMVEEAVVQKREGSKIYCKNIFNQKLIFDLDTKECYTDNTTFGAKRTLI